jgi:ribose transport system substrate-binding protein
MRMNGSTLLIAASIALGVAACGGSNNHATSASSTQGTSAAATPTNAASTTGPQLAALYKGDLGTPPASGPTAAKGKKILILSCGQQVPSCSTASAGAVAAANAIGWNVGVFDGKFNPATYGSGVEQAISEHVNGIIVDAVDCASVKPQLEQARKAGIKIVAVGSFDCNDPSIGGPKLFDGGLLTTGTRTPAEDTIKYGELEARFAAAKQGGKANVILFKLDAFLATKYIREGLELGFKQCPGCKIVDEVPLAPSDIGPALQQKVQSALLQYPQANTVMSDFDALLLAGVQAGVRAAGRGNAVKLFGAEGFTPDADFAREGQDAGGIAFDSTWYGWAAVDILNRIFHGQYGIVNEGLGHQAWDKDHNLPASGPWRSNVDFESAYKKVWGVG